MNNEELRVKNNEGRSKIDQINEINQTNETNKTNQMS